MENPLVLIAPPDHPLVGKKQIPLKQLEQDVFLLREPGSGTRSAMERFFAKHDISITASMEVSSDEAIKQSVQAGLGLSVMSQDAVEMELTLKRLVILDVAEFPIQRYWFLVHRKGKRLSAIAQAFKSFLLSDDVELHNKAD